MYIAIILVILSGLVHALWNLFTKRSIHKVAFLWFTQLVAIFVFLPFTITEMASTQIEAPPLAGWLLIAGSMTFHGLYVLLLAKAYTIGDLSQAYPIMRGISPLLVPVIGVLLLNEHVQFIGWVGILFIVFGIFLVGGIHSGRLLVNFNKVTLVAILVGVMITSYTVIDKLSLQYIPPFTLNAASNVGNLLALSWIALHSGALRQEWQINWRTIIIGGVLAPAGYIFFLMGLEIMPVSQLAPMREIGTVFGTVFGVLLLKEQQGRNRILASILITVGIILLAQ